MKVNVEDIVLGTLRAMLKHGGFSSGLISLTYSSRTVRYTFRHKRAKFLYRT